jgi:hypothetical protein
MFHYANFLAGERAQGLGGAFAGVSDDASALVYNPGGLAFLQGTDLSASANTFWQRKTTYEKVIGSSSFTEESQGFTPTFFGVGRRLGDSPSALVGALAIYSPDTDNKDQDDLIHAGKTLPFFHRTSQMRSSTLHGSIGFAKRVTPTLGVGVSSTYFERSDITQEYQKSVMQTSVRLATGLENRGPLYEVVEQNLHENLLARGVAVGVGAQWMIGSISLGVSAQIPFVLSQRFKQGVDYTQFYRLGDGTILRSDEVAADTSADQVATVAAGKVWEISQSQDEKKDVYKVPTELRAGLAWFASPALLLAVDGTYHTATTTSKREANNRVATWNAAAGAEYFLAPSLPVRAGIFTNRDARPDLGKNDYQHEHIDYYGTSLQLGWVRGGSQVSAGAVYQVGSGKAEKLAGSTKQQNANSRAIAASFSASQKL